MSVGILDPVAALDFKSPFDELSELREVLTTQEIAELTGLRRETISRARPDGRFQRRTAKALGDLYLVVTKLRAVLGEEEGKRHLASVLRRPQAEFAGRSIAELLRDGQVDVVLQTLSSDAPPSDDEVVRDPDLDRRIDALLDADPELRTRLSAIEAALIEHFGPGARVERQIIDDYDSLEKSEELYLRVVADLSLDENLDRLAKFLEQESDLMAPVRARLIIGFL